MDNDAITARQPPSSADVRRPRLVAGTLATTDLQAARRFYEEFLGLDCVRCGDDRLLARDRFAKAAMEAGDPDAFVLDVRLVEEITHPQRMLHHWGLDVSSVEEVNRIHAEAKGRQAEFQLKRVMPVSNLHGAHSFYFADRDSNWWEIEYRMDELSNEGFFARGDLLPVPTNTGEFSVPKEVHRPPATAPASAVVGLAELTHGTCEQLDLDLSRAFLEEVLRVRSVRHLEPAQLWAGSGSFAVFAIRQPAIREQSPLNRWILCYPDDQAVRDAHRRAQESKDRYEIASIGVPADDGQGLAFTLQDRDGNWWEAGQRGSADYQKLFERGDA